MFPSRCLAAQEVTRSAVEFENLRPGGQPPAVLDLPAPTGPYSVGTLTYYWADPERRDEYGPRPDGPHQVIAQLWYPADGASQVRPAYMPGLDQFRLAFHLRIRARVSFARVNRRTFRSNAGPSFLIVASRRATAKS